MPLNRTSTFILQTVGLLLLILPAPAMFGQAALLLEQPYGVFGTVNPTGHAALYLARVCADTPIHLRMCQPGENGVVISRYKGMGGYDWVAIPLIPYLYAVDDPAQVPAEVDEEAVSRLRNHYRELRLGEFGEKLPRGNFVNGGWTQLIGTAYDRRTYAFRFETDPEKDRQLVDLLNARSNRSHFNLLYNNCADFDRLILNHYFPHVFGRMVFPDAAITTPKQVTYKLLKYAKRNPQLELTVVAIPQVPGFRHQSRADEGVTESVIKTGYIVPIVLLNPYVAGGFLVDYLVRGRYHLLPKHPILVGPENMNTLIQSIGERSQQLDTSQAPLSNAKPVAPATASAIFTPLSGTSAGTRLERNLSVMNDSSAPRTTGFFHVR